MTLAPALEALKQDALRTSCASWAIRRRWPLARSGGELVGACPNCGDGGKKNADRFSISEAKNVFNCRRCGISGEGVIKLVMKTEGVAFTAACEIITGRKASEERDPAELAAIEAANAIEAQRRTRDAERYRENARRSGFRIWRDAVRLPTFWQGSAVGAYLKRRGIGWMDLGTMSFAAIVLREAILDYRHEQTSVEGRKTWRTLHTGPAMIAAVQRPDGSFGAVHQTWLDPGQDKGKLVLVDAEGRSLPAKKVLGAKKGGAMRLYMPMVRDAGSGELSIAARRIVMGEGIETTLTALAHNFEPATAYWAGVDLGNMAGKAFRDDAGKRHEAEPDLDDVECFLPPDWCEELIYLCDSDEPEAKTVEKVTRGLKRARILRERARRNWPELVPLETSFVEPVGDGKDLNDLVRVTT